MSFLTPKEKAKIYTRLYIDHYSLGDYLNALKAHGLSLEQDEAEVVWESIDQYEDMRPSEV